MAAQFVVPLLLLVFCTWKGEHRKFGAMVGLASSRKYKTKEVLQT
jgi:hypothetical protein